MTENLKNNNSRLSLSEREKSNRNAQIIINIGKGIFRPVNFREEISKVNKFDVIKNQLQWHNVSSNKKGMAKYSPYIKDNYNFMIAKNIYRESKMNLYSNPDLEKISEDEFLQFANRIKADMINSFRNANLSVRNCAVFIEQFEADIKEAYMIYVRLNSEYTYKNCLLEHSQDLATDLNANLTNITDEKVTEEILNITMQKKVLECLELGIPKTDIALSVLYNGIYKFISQYCDSISTELFIKVFKSLNIADFRFTDYIDNPENTIFNMVEIAKNLYAENLQKMIENNVIIKTKQKELALKEFFDWYKTNKYAHPDDIDNEINTLMNKYNVSDDLYLNSIFESKSLLENSNEVDIYALCELERKSVTGSLNFADLEVALLNKQIKINDAIRISQNADKDINPEVILFEMSYNPKLFENSRDLRLERDITIIKLDKGIISLKQAQKQIEEVINK